MDFKESLKNRASKDLTRQRLDDLAWFLGFAEGDGSWMGFDNPPRNQFIINQKDPKVLYKVKKILGFGRVRELGSGYFRYAVTDLAGTLEIIRICNGNLILEKSKARFKNYLEIFNSREKKKFSAEDKEEIPFLDHKPQISLDNAWLAGFIDAEGCFSVQLRENKRPVLAFTLVQKGEGEIMNRISDLLAGNTYYEEKKDAYRSYIRSLKGREILLNYFKKFSLYSVKSVDKSRFAKVHIRLTDGSDHSTPKARARFHRLLEELKKNRDQ